MITRYGAERDFFFQHRIEAFINTDEKAILAIEPYFSIILYG